MASRAKALEAYIVFYLQFQFLILVLIHEQADDTMWHSKNCASDIVLRTVRR